MNQDVALVVAMQTPDVLLLGFLPAGVGVVSRESVPPQLRRGGREMLDIGRVLMSF
jgi:hypothetical protein